MLAGRLLDNASTDEAVRVNSKPTHQPMSKFNITAQPEHKAVILPALRREARRKTLRQHGGSLYHLLAEVSPKGYGVQAIAASDAETAYHRIIPRGTTKVDGRNITVKRETHLIALGRFYTGAKKGLPTKSLIDFGAAVVVHETCHARYTELANANVIAECTRRKIPFRLWNLFEDVRIEAIHRSIHGNWRWQRWVEVPETTNQPLGLVQSGRFTDFTGNSSKWNGALRTALGSPTVSFIREFCKRVCACPSTAALFPLIEEWLKHFPAPADQRPTGPLTSPDIGGEGDPTEGPGGGKEPEGGHATAPCDTPTEELPKDYGKDIPDTPHASSPNVKLDYYARLDHIAGYAKPANDLQRSTEDRLTDLLSQLCQRAETAPNTYGLAGKVVPHLAAAGEQGAFLRRGEEAGRRSLTVILDCSGSMSGHWTQHFKALAVAFLRLHKRRVLDLKLVLTGGTAHHVVDVDRITEAGVRCIGRGHGNETVRDTLIAIDQYAVRNSDVVAIWTDGALTDGHVDAGEWRARGVDLIGCCVCTPQQGESARDSVREALKRHFRNGIIGSTIFHVARELAEAITRHKGR